MFSELNWRMRLLGSAATALALAGAITTVAAQEAVELDVITVVGQGEGNEAGVLTTTADKEELERKMIEDVSDLGRVDAAVNFNSNSNSINLRGLDENRVLTTIDGIRVPWLTDPRESAKGGLNAFDFDTLSAIDITRGADSVRYGSGVLGGVIALRTLDPEDLIKEGRNWGAILKGTYDSSDASWRTNAAIAGRHNDTYFLLQGGYRRGHETDNRGNLGGDGYYRTIPDPEDYDQTNVLAKLHQHFDGGHRLGITGEIFNRDETVDERSATTNSDNVPQYQPGDYFTGTAIKRERVSLNYDFISPDGESLLDEAHLTTFWMRQKLNEWVDGTRLVSPTGLYQRDNLVEQTSYGLFGDARKEFSLGGVAHTLRFGGGLYQQKTHQYSAGFDNCDTQPSFACGFLHTNASDMPDVDSTSFGLFVENDIHLPGNFTLTPGIRFDWFEHKPQMTADFQKNPNFTGLPPSNSGSNVSGKLRGSWQPTHEIELYAQWAQAFRAPTALELYQNFGTPGRYERIGDPNLKPETSNGFEVGASYTGLDYSVAVSLFNNYYRNFIDQVSLGATPTYPMGVFQNVNRAKVHIYGAELRGQWNFATDWRAWGSVAWTVGRDTSLDEHLNSIPPLRAILGLGYATEQWGTDLSVTLAAARDKVGSDGFKAPAYGVVDVTAWWEPEQVEGLRLQAGVFNLFDTKYWNAIDVPDAINPAVRDRYSEPGRSFRFTVSKQF